jgi:hypothetical protein
MNSCSNASRVFAHASAGEELPAGLAAHAAGCGVCQAALERAGRFQAELHAGATSLATPAMPDLSRGLDASLRRKSPTALVPIVGTVAAAILTVAVVIAGYQMITAPVGSLETSSPTPSASPMPSEVTTEPPSPTPTPSPVTSPAPTATTEPSGVPVPSEFTNRTELPSCGHEVVERTFEGDFHDAEATACFLAAYEAGEPAEFISESLTPETGRITTVFRVLGPGQIEIFRDSTQDPLSTPEWTRTMCDSIREIDQDPNGVPILIGDECDEPVVLSD